MVFSNYFKPSSHLYHTIVHISNVSKPPKITSRVAHGRTQWHGQDHKTMSVKALECGAQPATSRALFVQCWRARVAATRAAHWKLPDDMLLLDGGARIEETDHLQCRQSATAAHTTTDCPGWAQYGQPRTRMRSTYPRHKPPHRRAPAHRWHVLARLALLR